MKWIGQHIFDFVSRFRNDIHVGKKLHDSSGSSGATGKILTTDGSVLSWTDATYTHTQSQASATWTITHNLNKFPSVTVIDSGDSVVVGEILFNPANQLTITFFGNGNSVAFSGKAYLN
jgi:hypothetical protein